MIDFRTAVEARDLDAIAAALADNVVFRSPVAFKPYPGKALTAAILRGVLRVFQDFRYVRELSGDDGRDHALVFTARIDDVVVEGCDFLHLDDSGLIDEFTVMVRPLSAAQTLAAAMAAQFEQISARPLPAGSAPDSRAQVAAIRSFAACVPLVVELAPGQPMRSNSESPTPARSGTPSARQTARKPSWPALRASAARPRSHTGRGDRRSGAVGEPSC